MSGVPPRARPRAVPPPPPRQPYPLATDLETDEYDVALEDEVPFDLESDEVPTMRDLSVQIGAVDRRVRVVRREVALTRKELGELRTYVMGDQAPRISAVERKHHSIPPLPPAAKTAGKYTAVALAIPTLLQLVSALKPDLAGPIQLISKLFGGQ